MSDMSIKILLADDDFGFRFPLAALLKDLKYEVVVVPDADAVRKHYDSVDVLVLDAMLPTAEFEGIGVVADLRNSDAPSL